VEEIGLSYLGSTWKRSFIQYNPQHCTKQREAVYQDEIGQLSKLIVVWGEGV
jgi:hypothetical protein